MPLKCYQFNHKFNNQNFIKFYTNNYFKLESLFFINTYKLNLRKIVFKNHNLKSEINLNDIFLFNLSLISIISYFFHNTYCLYYSCILLIREKYSIRESLIYSSDIKVWEGYLKNNSLPIFEISKIDLYKFQLQKFKEIKLIGKLKIFIIITFPRLIFVKNKIIGVIFIFKLIYLIIIRNLYNSLDKFPCGSYLLERLTIDDKLEVENLYSLLYLDKEILFYIILLFILIISLMIINIIIIIFIMFFIKNYIRYKNFIFLTLQLNNIKQIINRCKILGFITINICNVLYWYISQEVLLFSSNNIVNSLFKDNLSTTVLSSYKGKETEINLNKNINSSQIVISPSTVNSLSNMNEISNEQELARIESGDSDNSDNEISNNIEKFLRNKMANLNFTNFNLELNLEVKYEYLKYKFYLKGLDCNLPYLEWFINLLNNSDGNKTNIDNIIENNLNHILKIERDSKLNNLAFFRNKPFLINKLDDSPLAYPNIIPIFKGNSIYGEEDKIEYTK